MSYNLYSIGYDQLPKVRSEPSIQALVERDDSIIFLLQGTIIHCKVFQVEEVCKLCYSWDKGIFKNKEECRQMQREQASQRGFVKVECIEQIEVFRNLEKPEVGKKGI